MLNIRLFGNLILVSRVSLQVRNWPRTSNQITSQIIQDIVSLESATNLITKKGTQWVVKTLCKNFQAHSYYYSGLVSVLYCILGWYGVLSSCKAVIFLLCLRFNRKKCILKFVYESDWLKYYVTTRSLTLLPIRLFGKINQKVLFQEGL